MKRVGLTVGWLSAMALMAGCPLPSGNAVTPAPGSLNPGTPVSAKVAWYTRIELIEPAVPTGQAVPAEVLDGLGQALATELSGVPRIEEVRTSLAPLATSRDVLRVSCSVTGFQPPPSDGSPGGRLTLRVALHDAATGRPLGDVVVKARDGQSVKSLCAGIARTTSKWLEMVRKPLPL